MEKSFSRRKGMKQNSTFLTGIMIIFTSLMMFIFLPYAYIFVLGQEHISIRDPLELNANTEGKDKTYQMLYESYSKGTPTVINIDKDMEYTSDYDTIFDFYLKDYFDELLPNMEIEELTANALNYTFLPSFSIHKKNGKIDNIDVKVTEKDIMEYYEHQAIYEWIERNFDNSMTKYQALMKLGSFMGNNFEYDYKAASFDFNDEEIYNYRRSYSLYSLVENNKGTCQAFTIFYKYVCDALGIECYYEQGKDTKVGSSAHSWNVIVLHDVPLYIDSTNAYVTNKSIRSNLYLFSIDLSNRRTTQLQI